MIKNLKIKACKFKFKMLNKALNSVNNNLTRFKQYFKKLFRILNKKKTAKFMKINLLRLKFNHNKKIDKKF